MPAYVAQLRIVVVPPREAGSTTLKFSRSTPRPARPPPQGRSRARAPSIDNIFSIQREHVTTDKHDNIIARRRTPRRFGLRRSPRIHTHTHSLAGGGVVDTRGVAKLKLARRSCWSFLVRRVCMNYSRYGNPVGFQRSRHPPSTFLFLSPFTLLPSCTHDRGQVASSSSLPSSSTTSFFSSLLPRRGSKRG